MSPSADGGAEDRSRKTHESGGSGGGGARAGLPTTSGQAPSNGESPFLMCLCFCFRESCFSAV